MRKITLMFLAIFVVASSAFASTGWYSDYILINVNGATGSGYYWIGSDPSFGTQLDGADLGTVSSLVLTGCDLKYWSDTQDRTGGSFFYEILSSDGTTQVVAPVETIWDQTSLGGNDYQGKKSITIDLRAGLSPSTTYKLAIWAKSWGSGQGDSYLSNNTANYVATFTTDLGTGINENVLSNLSVSTKSGSIIARFNGTVRVELYSATGQLIRATQATNQFTQSVKSGAYLLKVNGQTHKVLVP